MNLRAEISLFIEAHEGREPEHLAEMFIRGCSADDLLPLLIDAFKQAVRANVRMEEIDILRQSAPTALRTSESVRAALDDLAPLLDLPYRIGDGTPRRFGAMTVDEHRTRMVMLSSQINGLQRDVGLHEHAVYVIEQNGVSCLDELASAKAA